MSSRTASCSCGQLRVQVEGEPRGVGTLPGLVSTKVSALNALKRSAQRPACDSKLRRQWVLGREHLTIGWSGRDARWLCAVGAWRQYAPAALVRRLRAAAQAHR
jgi:hypothetical protein